MILKDISTLTQNAKNAVVAIGNFDGVHKGHLYLLEQARQHANQLGVKLAVLTFEPHPRKFFSPTSESFRIAPEAVKLARLKAAQVDEVVSLPFNQSLANMRAADFVQDILINAFEASAIFVGEGFRFGYQREGCAEMMRRDGLDVHSIKPLSDHNAIVSSTRIRSALKEANISHANEMLGWEWFINGEVVHGDKRGRELGYPTANIWLEDTICPAYGIYAVEIERCSNTKKQWLKGAASIGIRPMFETRVPILEVFIFDFDEEIYGEILNVRPIVKIRDEVKFDSLDALIVQMDQDCKDARMILDAR